MERGNFTGMAFRGGRLRDARKTKGLSQTRLAQKIGAHVTSISDWERGANAPSGRHVASLSRELGVEVGEFYGDADDEEAASMGLTGGQRDLLAALALALEPFKPVREEVLA